MTTETGIVIDMQEGRINLLKNFNLAAKNSWSSFIIKAERAGFKDLDFGRRLNASASIVRQWKNNAGHPPPDKREDFRKIIIGVLQDRLPGEQRPPFDYA